MEKKNNPRVRTPYPTLTYSEIARNPVGMEFRTCRETPSGSTRNWDATGEVWLNPPKELRAEDQQILKAA